MFCLSSSGVSALRFKHQCPVPSLVRRVPFPRSLLAVQSGTDEKATTASENNPSSVSPGAIGSAPLQATESRPPVLEKGQGTAIWTGAVSVVFGIAYLVLVFFLDSRGGEMLPPPPEAYIP